MHQVLSTQALDMCSWYQSPGQRKHVILTLSKQCRQAHDLPRTARGKWEARKLIFKAPIAHTCRFNLFVDCEHASEHCIALGERIISCQCDFVKSSCSRGPLHEVRYLYVLLCIKCHNVQLITAQLSLRTAPPMLKGDNYLLRKEDTVTNSLT